MPITQEQYEKVKNQLLANGQQELAGHVDGLWQELTELRNKNSDNAEIQTAQQFQDQYKGDNPATVDKTEAQVDAETAAEKTEP